LSFTYAIEIVHKLGSRSCPETTRLGISHTSPFSYLSWS